MAKMSDLVAELAELKRCGEVLDWQERLKEMLQVLHTKGECLWTRRYISWNMSLSLRRMDII